MRPFPAEISGMINFERMEVLVVVDAVESAIELPKERVTFRMWEAKQWVDADGAGGRIKCTNV